jgi:hypothetical protein
VAAWTKGRGSVNQIGIALLHHWFVRPGPPRRAIADSEVLDVVARGQQRPGNEPRRLATAQRSLMVEHAMKAARGGLTLFGSPWHGD